MVHLNAATKKLLVLFSLFAIYVTLGMVMFVAIEDGEGGASNEESTPTDLKKRREDLKRVTMAQYKMTSVEFDELYRQIRDSREAEESDESKWSYKNSFSFVVQVVTTVGYGDITPKTTAGRILCIFYAFFGIPITVLFLQAIGEEILKLQQKLLRRGLDAEPSYLNEKCVVTSLLFLLALMFIGALVQILVEDWSLLDGMYCYFITFTTIGFGDFIPGRREYAIDIFHPFFIILGLVVMSNVLNGLVGCTQTIAALKKFCCCHARDDSPPQASVTIADVTVDGRDGGGEI